MVYTILCIMIYYDVMKRVINLYDEFSLQEILCVDQCTIRSRKKKNPFYVEYYVIGIFRAHFLSNASSTI